MVQAAKPEAIRRSPVVETVDVDAPADFLKGRSFAELTRAVFGKSLSAAQVARAIGWDKMEPSTEPANLAENRGLDKRRLSDGTHQTTIKARQWIGSVGYERFQDNRTFATVLRRAGIERLIDVREIAISRRDGYSKSQLANALSTEGIEYVHLPRLGNPKEIRDLYKSGREADGKARYQEFLLAERTGDLRALAPVLAERRSALMCVEHDYHVCHRKVILDALRQELGLNLRIAKIS